MKRQKNARRTHIDFAENTFCASVHALGVPGVEVPAGIPYVELLLGTVARICCPERYPIQSASGPAAHQELAKRTCRHRHRGSDFRTVETIVGMDEIGARKPVLAVLVLGSHWIGDELALARSEV